MSLALKLLSDASAGLRDSPGLAAMLHAAGHRALALLAGAYALARAVPLLAGVRMPYARRADSLELR